MYMCVYIYIYTCVKPPLRAQAFLFLIVDHTPSSTRL